MKILVGLGNPDSEYEATRHNFGFAVIDSFQKHVGGEFQNSKFKAAILDVRDQQTKVLLVKPTTFMNLSGEAVGRILSFYKKGPMDLMVVHDDLDLPLGRIKFSASGSSGGHKGVQSIIEELNTDEFPRLRLGIDHPPPGKDGANYVLETFSKQEKPMVTQVIDQAVQALQDGVRHGLPWAMNHYNRK